MSAKPAKQRGVHTGRNDRIRAFFAEHGRELVSARQVRDAADPGASIDAMCATLYNMARAGHLLRVGQGKGNVRWGGVTEFVDRRTGLKVDTRPGRQCAAHDVTDKARTAAARERNRPRSMRETISGTARATQPARRRGATNFHAALGTVEHHHDPKRASSNRIAADIAAFQAQGGHVEVLPVLRLFDGPVHTDSAPLKA